MVVDCRAGSPAHRRRIRRCRLCRRRTGDRYDHGYRDRAQAARSGWLRRAFIPASGRPGLRLNQPHPTPPEWLKDRLCQNLPLDRSPRDPRQAPCPEAHLLEWPLG